MSTHTASPQVGSHLHTWCMPLYLCLKNRWTHTSGEKQKSVFVVKVSNCNRHGGNDSRLWNSSYLRRWHRPDDRAHKSFCGRCNKSLDHKSSDTCLLEGWRVQERNKNIYSDLHSKHNKKKNTPATAYNSNCISEKIDPTAALLQFPNRDVGSKKKNTTTSITVILFPPLLLVSVHLQKHS